MSYVSHIINNLFHPQTEAENSALNRVTTYRRILVLFTILYALLVFYGASMGVRGTDQYWYIADIETVATGKPAVSNNLYPPSVLDNEFSGSQPFIHNTPYVYLASLPAKLFGPFAGAIVLNAFSFLIASYLIFLILQKFKINDRIAASTAGIFLLFPMNYWLTVNAMSEALLVPAVVFLGWLAVRNDRMTNLSWILSLLTIGFMIFTRESLIILGLLFPFIYLLDTRKLNWKSIFISATMLAFVFCIYWARGILLPHNVQCSFTEMIARMTPGVTDNMFCYFNTEDTRLDFSLWWTKISANIYNQFSLTNSVSHDGSISLSFYLPTNVLVGIALYLSFWKSTDHRTQRLGFLLLALVLVHLATLVLIENLPRYLIILPPLAFALTTISVRTTLLQRNNLTKGLFFLSILLVFTTADLVAAQKTRSNASREANQVFAIEKLVNHYSDREAIGFIETDVGDNMCLISYALKDHPVVFSRSNYAQTIKNAIAGKVKPEFAILRPNSVLNENPKMTLNAVARMPAPFSAHTLYQINYD